MNEAVDAVRAAARGRGHTERIVLTADVDFDWARLLHEGRNLSLFAARQIIELRMLSGKPGTAGSQALQRYCASAPDTNLLLITAPKLDTQAQKAEWFAALDRAGVVIQVKAVEARELPGWIAGRLQNRGFRPTGDAVAALAGRVEGNLLAAAQEIEKLQLLYGSGEIGLESVLDAVADSARFTVYHFADSALRGESARVVRILNGLRAEGVEPAIVLWALVRELRSLTNIAYDLKNGTPIEQVLAKHRVWEHRKPMVRHALKRHPLSRLRRLLRQAGTCDQIIKGIRQGSPWDALMQLSLALAGQDLGGPLSSEEIPLVAKLPL